MIESMCESESEWIGGAAHIKDHLVGRKVRRVHQINDKIWCGCGPTISIYNPFTYRIDERVSFSYLMGIFMLGSAEAIQRI